MIHFKTVQWKNFLSTGNAFTTIQLDKNPTNLIVGENGSGKSTLLDAICFALFGKPYRNINKPQLVNTINSKNCVVELYFQIGKKQYKIIRGLKPNVFEIWIDDVLLNKDAASKDYQKYLEETILKLNYKSFTQIVILGSASFTPFMQLPAASRREVIEDILDIKIFTAMNSVLKDKVTTLKQKISETDAAIAIAKNKAQLQQDYIKTLQDDRDARISEIETKIHETLHDIQEKKMSVTIVEDKKEALVSSILDLGEVTQNIERIVRQLNDLTSSEKRIDTEIHFYQINDNCPKCKQAIEQGFKQTIIDEQSTELQKVHTSIHKIREDEQKLHTRLNDIKAINLEIGKLNDLIHTVKSDINASERFIQRLQLEKNDIVVKVGNIEQEKNKLKAIASESLEIAKQKGELGELQTYYDIASVLLKDSGIKTRIIRQYLPVINKLVNKYLTEMNFFVQFTLDEKFDEIIKSRYRDDFSYESFSEGEKQRIDLALLFTWRTIAKVKNSTSTNLLILDEVFDSSLDASATELVMQLLNTLAEGTNVWVISHKGDQLFDKFTNILRFKKKKNFSIVA
jgi:DNA repair exonuclease SbcCD ATPase subunit